MRRFATIAIAFVFATSLLIPAPAFAAESGESVSAAGLAGLLAVSEATPTGYDRALFTHWIDADGNGCDTRQEVLIAESVTPVTIGDDCSIVGGQWDSWFDGASRTDPAQVDIDHFVPLSEAWRSGANAWNAATRQAFANDLEYADSLFAVTDNANSSKGDSDPARWLPPLNDSPTVCRYVTTWALVKYRWSLSVDSAEQARLTELLGQTCGTNLALLPVRAHIVLDTVTPPVTPAPPSPPAASTPPASTPVYRFWSPVYNGHFFTTSAAEKNSIIRDYPGIWTYEGERFRAFSTQVAGTVPLYRFWSAKMNGHFYTTSEAEKKSVIADYDDATWKYERIAYYVYPAKSTVANTSAVERFWSSTYQHHFYTAVAAEAAQVKTYPKPIWSYERTSFRVPTSRVVLPPVTKPMPPVATPKPPVAPPPPTRPANPGDSKNCSDFSTWNAAKAWYDYYFRYYGDIAGLDGNPKNGIPCESLPGSPRR